MPAGPSELAECWAFAVRRAERAVTRRFNDALRGSPLRATQLTLLAAVQAERRVSVGELARRVGVEPTTLTRNLRVLEDRGFVEVTAGGDRRTRLVSITPSGRDVVLEALPAWRRAQAELSNVIGSDREVLRQLLSRLERLGDASMSVAPGADES